MKQAQEATDREAILAAARLNWRLWTIFQSELLDPQCTVPTDVRVNVLTLAQFVDKRTVEILGDPQPEKLDALISIDRELAAGLYTKVPADRDVPPPGDAVALDAAEAASSAPLKISA